MPRPNSPAPTFRPEVEGLEDRLAPATFTVTTDNNNGPGSLRDAIVRANPFPEVAEDEPARLLAMFLKRKPDTNLAEALLEAIPGPERLVAHGSELYIHYPDGMGKSKLSGNMIESKLKARGTARNWNTVLKLHAMLRG